MTDTTLWWMAAGVIVGLELLTGTFYLLMLALGAAAAAVAANMGHPLPTQILIAAVVGGVAALGWHLKRQRSKDHAQSEGRANPDLHLDLGQTVEVAQWSADGRTRVHYRGADWDARYRGAPPAQPGPHRIQAVEGNTLVLAKI
ncbi:NfeD family protein [Aquabacterium sp.]|uniref:NfeD family protein n=1 Tax=Aquabacterium sp. TaxID=1872578 RepID=UPI0019B14399|nr:NfeD family protein [Aquabacterium sp.]MBC7701973.1 NfeD family protein [Aquabacterium sp.]